MSHWFSLKMLMGLCHTQLPTFCRPRTLPVFSGKDLLEWLQGQQQQQPEAQAQALLQAVLITPAVPFDAAQSAKAPSPMPFKASELYSLEVPPPAKGQPLNSHIWWTGPARPAVQGSAGKKNAGRGASDTS
eukprot:1136474-Pelagomonas_calceolata.AAC.2